MNSSHTLAILDHAESIGFDRCGIVRAEKFPELERLPEWLERGYAGEMHYLEDPRRGDPRLVLEGVQSIIVVLLNYNSAHPRSVAPSNRRGEAPPEGWVSRYAWGRDYHRVLEERLDRLTSFLRARFEAPFEAKAYVDTGPVNERLLAKYAGLGWIGKNTLLLNQMLGSYFFLGVILTTLGLEPTLAEGELPPPDLCGSCQRCLEACPTQAFPEPYLLDPRRCISYLTIELRGSIPEPLREGMGNHVFGCDICQDVCPWNRRAPITPAGDFEPRELPGEEYPFEGEGEAAGSRSLFRPELRWLVQLSEEEFHRLFRDSPIRRAKWQGFLRNSCIALGNAGLTRGSAQAGPFLSRLGELAVCGEPLVEESARWALSRIR